MTNYTHEIIRMERSFTQGSRSPMWKCQTADGQRVNVFKHERADRNTFRYFDLAGYGPLMETLKVGEGMEWAGYPIRVQMGKSGDWWEVHEVELRPAGAEPDLMWEPDLKAYKERAQQQALLITDPPPYCCVLDFETTGLGMDDEIVAVAIFDGKGLPVLDSLVRPANPAKLLRKGKSGQSASEINGITPEMVESAPTFADLYPQIERALSGKRWVAYNAPFDVGMLDRHCSDAGMPLLVNRGVFDAAKLAAEYLGKWNPKRQWFENISLTDAMVELGLAGGIMHRAAADAKATLDVLLQIANGYESWADDPA